MRTWMFGFTLAAALLVPARPALAQCCAAHATAAADHAVHQHPGAPAQTPATPAAQGSMKGCCADHKAQAAPKACCDPQAPPVALADPVTVDDPAIALAALGLPAGPMATPAARAVTAH